VVVTLLFAVGGLLVGVIFAMQTSKLAYYLLKKESALSSVIYSLLPIIAIPASIGIVIAVSHLILR